MPAALYLKREQIFYGALLAFMMLSINVMIGLNAPNPDHIMLQQVAMFGR